jgi:hypothetical protein
MLAYLLLLREVVMNRYVVIAFVSIASLLFYFTLHAQAGHADVSEVIGEFAVLVTGAVLI